MEKIIDRSSNPTREVILMVWNWGQNWRGAQRPLIISILACFFVATFLCFNLITHYNSSAGVHRANQATWGRSRAIKSIAIVTWGYNVEGKNEELRFLTWKNKRVYAKNGNYDIYDAATIPVIHHLTEKLQRKMYSKNFFKWIALREILRGSRVTNMKKYDWVFWMDRDSIFLNFGKGLHQLLDDRFDVIFTADPPSNPTLVGVPSTKNFLIKNSDFSERFVEDVLQMSRQHCGDFTIKNPVAGHLVNGWIQLCNPDGGFWGDDQGIVMALHAIKKPAYRCHIKRTGHRAFNSQFPLYANGDLAVQLSGRSPPDLLRLLKAFSRFTNFSTGTIDYNATHIFHPVDNIDPGALSLLEKIYLPINPLCDSEGWEK